MGRHAQVLLPVAQDQLVQLVPPRLDPLPDLALGAGLGHRAGEDAAPLAERDVPHVPQRLVDVLGGELEREVVGAAQDHGPVVGGPAALGQELGLDAPQEARPGRAHYVPRQAVRVRVDVERGERGREDRGQALRVGVRRGPHLRVARRQGVAEAEDAEGASWFLGLGAGGGRCRVASLLGFRLWGERRAQEPRRRRRRRGHGGGPLAGAPWQ